MMSTHLKKVIIQHANATFVTAAWQPGTKNSHAKALFQIDDGFQVAVRWQHQPHVGWFDGNTFCPQRDLDMHTAWRLRVDLEYSAEGAVQGCRGQAVQLHDGADGRFGWWFSV